MTETLTIVARIVAAPGQADALADAMAPLVEDTRKEAGCLQYDLHRGTETPDLFVFVEEWETKPLWEAHMSGAAIQAFRERIDAGMIAESEVMQLNRIG